MQPIVGSHLLEAMETRIVWRKGGSYMQRSLPNKYFYDNKIIYAIETRREFRSRYPTFDSKCLKCSYEMHMASHPNQFYRELQAQYPYTLEVT